MKAVLILSFVMIIRAKPWSNVRNPFEMIETTPVYHSITDCMHVTSEDGDYAFQRIPHVNPSMSRNDYNKRIEGNLPPPPPPAAASHVHAPSMAVCGLYVVTDPNKLVEISIKTMDVNCESGGLMAFVDGWELNGQYFPGINDHQLDLNQRITEFCNDNSHWPLKPIKRIFRSSQNAALLQYRIPIRGSFIASVRFITNPAPCNIMAEGVAPLYELNNNGHRNNCTLTVLYPAVVSINALSVGGLRNDVSYDCDQENTLDRIDIGGSTGLDSYLMEKSSSICGHTDKIGPEQAIFCGVTSIRLSSSGNYQNKALITVRPSDENDLAIATLVCQL